MMVWSADSVNECPGCGATVAVGIMSLSATCKIDGFFFADIIGERRGWYSSHAAYARGDRRVG